jgi:hypothetical protein
MAQQHFGRPLGFAGAALFMAIGNAMFAACTNVDTFLVSLEHPRSS